MKDTKIGRESKTIETDDNKSKLARKNTQIANSAIKSVSKQVSALRVSQYSNKAQSVG